MSARQSGPAPAAVTDNAGEIACSGCKAGGGHFTGCASYRPAASPGGQADALIAAAAGAVETGTHVVEALDVALSDVTSEDDAVSAKELLYALNDSGWYLTRRRPASATTGRGDDE